MDIKIKCPKCGKELKRNYFSGFECDKECGFKLYNPTYGRHMKDDEYLQLCEEGKTSLLDGFVRKDGTKYSARLKFDENFNTIPYWENSDNVNSNLKCPICGKPIRKGPKGWCCSGRKDGCKFVVWNEIAGHTLTETEKTDLIKNGKTGLIVGFKGRKGDFNARLILDENKEVKFSFLNKGEA